MTVVERHDQAEREAIRDEVRAEMAQEKHSRQLKGCGCALLAFAVLIGAPIGLTIWVIAKSGFIEIPVLSDLVYRPPAPVRQVVPLVGTDAETIAKSLAATAKPGSASGTAEITVSEQELTTFLAAAVQSGDLPQLPLAGKITSAQAAIDPDFIEIYLSAAMANGQPQPIILRVLPTVVSGQLNFRVKEAVLGSFPLPAAIFEPLLNKAAASAMARMSGTGGAVLTAIRLTSGHMTLVFAAAR